MRLALALTATLIVVAPAAAVDCPAAIRNAEQFIDGAPDLSSVETEMPLEECLQLLQDLDLPELRPLEAKVRRLLKHFDQAPQRQAE